MPYKDPQKRKEFQKVYQENYRKLKKASPKPKTISTRVKLSEEEKKQRKKLYYEKNKEKLLNAQKEWIRNNKDHIREKQKEKYNTDTLYKLKTNIKNLIGNSLRNNNFKKLSRTEEILGCTYEDFKIYLESKFEPWMNWDNRGLYNGEPRYGWDIDHIIPLSSAKDEFDLIRLNHHSNLMPLCSHYNRDIKRG